MKKQVKEWIVDKNLTIDSFDNIMIGVIYNSRHNILDDPDVRNWIGMHPSEFREMLPSNLNENQKLALEVLKIAYEGRGNCADAIYWALEDDSLPKLEKKGFYTSHTSV